ncbi:MAG: pyrroline-5-carboxylate reductase [bacterium]|jgi:pyrroline-5-carboxylate reductase|nr:pyrroline-5-carboxylate reductase [Bacillota bacterium]HHW54170.1 pyrroline-5-carboxylate reductase [Bacillota bacterium]
MAAGEKSFGFIGAGAMGSALMRGIVQGDLVKAGSVFASDPDKGRLQEIVAELGINPVKDNGEVLEKADVVVLAVKPQVIEEVLEPLKGKWSPKQLVISIAAGISLQKLESYIQGAPVIRVMPNTPCLVGAGAAGIALGSRAGEEEGKLAQELFAAVGEAFIVPEDLLDAVTGLSGSGPAYCYLFIEALADAGVQEGLPRPIAQRLAALTLLGAARMVLETEKHPGELKDMVTSPAGTTIAAVSVLEKRAFRGTVIEAVRAASRRSREMAEKG